MAEARLVGGRFELGGQIGAGGMGRVFRAIDRQTDTTVAIKLLRFSIDAERFAREARLLQQVTDDHVVRYIDHGIDRDGSLYLAMEWIEGYSLSHRLAHVGLDVSESVRLVRAVAGGLAAAHRVGIVHRDIKPSNILLAGGDPARACVIDLGIGRQRDDVSPLTRSGAVLGTPGYMAPEQARGVRQIDERADVFALGAIFYECLTGRQAFTGSSPLAVQCKVLAFHPTPIEEVCPDAPPALCALVARMLDKLPALRPPDASAVVDELAEIAIGPSTSRRSRHSSVAATVAARPTELDHEPRLARFVALATPLIDDDGVVTPITAEVARAVEECASREGIEAVAMYDGSWLLVVEDPDENVGAGRAVGLAHALAQLMPGGEVVVSGARAPRAALAIDQALDDGSAALAVSVRETMFSPIAGAPRPGLVRLDELTAGLLPAPFVVARSRGVPWLVEIRR